MHAIDCVKRVLGSVNRKKIMMKEKILINHWRWLAANEYKHQAASCKLQAASLTRKYYKDIVSYKRKDKKL